MPFMEDYVALHVFEHHLFCISINQFNVTQDHAKYGHAYIENIAKIIRKKKNVKNSQRLKNKTRQVVVVE